MGRVREHEPFVIEEINGLWARGDDESCPADHLLVAHNIQFFHSGIETRTAVQPYLQQVYAADLRQTLRIYNYTTQTQQTLLILVEGGIIYHMVNETEIYNILELPGMEDFAFISIAGRAYISPFKTYTKTSGENYSLGLRNESLYVYYRPPGTPVSTTIKARKAAGSPPFIFDSGFSTNKPFQAYESSVAGVVTAGSHAFSVAYYDGINLGKVMATTTFAVTIATGNKSVELINIPRGPVETVNRRILMTKANTYKPEGPNEFFEVATIAGNTISTYRFNAADATFTTPFVPGLNAALTTNALTVANTNDPGFCDIGFHLVGIVFETDTGYLTAIGPQYFGGNTYINESKAILVDHIPLGPEESPGVVSRVVKRHIVSTKMIPEYNGDQKGYQFFFVPNGTLENNTATQKEISYYDSDLVADASHLMDNFSSIPAGVDLAEYHSRLVLVGDSSYPKNTAGVEDTTKPDNRSVAWVSAPGEPEAFNQIDGLIITPLDGNPLTHAQEFRDVLYLFKQNRTYSIVDNDDEPTTWGPVEAVDMGIGCSVHGMAEVLDSGATNVDYLIIVDWSGLMLFNGTYARPELSWKIEDVWMNFDRNEFRHIQIINDSLHKKIWLVDPLHPATMLWMADYGNGMNPKDIRWSRWNFDIHITTIALHKIDKMIMGTYQETANL